MAGKAQRDERGEHGRGPGKKSKPRAAPGVRAAAVPRSATTMPRARKRHGDGREDCCRRGRQDRVMPLQYEHRPMPQVQGIGNEPRADGNAGAQQRRHARRSRGTGMDNSETMPRQGRRAARARKRRIGVEGHHRDGDREQAGAVQRFARRGEAGRRQHAIGRQRADEQLPGTQMGRVEGLFGVMAGPSAEAHGEGPSSTPSPPSRSHHDRDAPATTGVAGRPSDALRHRQRPGVQQRQAFRGAREVARFEPEEDIGRERRRGHHALAEFA